jgi:hypothetical protein
VVIGGLLRARRRVRQRLVGEVAVHDDGSSKRGGVCVSAWVGALPSTMPVVLERRGREGWPSAACYERGGVCVSVWVGRLPSTWSVVLERRGREG